MGSVGRRPHRPGWVARYRDPSGRQRSKSFRREVDARRFLTAIEADKLYGRWIDPKLAEIPFGRYADEWLQITVHEPGTRLNIEGRLRNHILPFFKDLPLVAIKSRHVRSWVTELRGKGLAPATVVATYNTFAKIIRTAVIDGLIATTPCLGIDLPHLGKREEMRFLDPHAINVLADSLEPRYRALIYTAGYTGMRWGELAALRAENLNLLHGLVDVVETQTEISGNIQIKPYTKTGGRRTISLPGFLAEMIGRHMGVYPSAERVFSAAQGGPLRRTFYRRHFLPGVQQAGLAPLRFHDLRHSCVAMLISEGAHPAEIMQRLGHSSVKTTLDRYGHLFPSLDLRLKDGLQRLYQESISEADVQRDSHLGRSS